MKAGNERLMWVELTGHSHSGRSVVGLALVCGLLCGAFAARAAEPSAEKLKSVEQSIEQSTAH